MEAETRRRFLGRAAAGGAWLLGAGCGRQVRRPNILFCLADDQSYPHAGAYGSAFVKTPAFDRVAREGVLFHNTFVSAPSCCPSRSSVLTGQDFYRLREASMNHAVWPAGIDVYPDMLQAAGYHTGYTGKGWGPGNWKVSGRQYSPAGVEFNQLRLEPPGRHISNIDYAGNFEAFLRQRPKNAPFCFWAGFIEPHREYEEGIGVRHGKKLEEIQVPGFFPDVEEVRKDIADYAYEIEWCDSQLGRMLTMLEKSGELDNTLIVVTADNGMPFPRAKATLYDYGTRMPLAIRWGARVRQRREVTDFVSFTDFAPTFLEAAGLAVPASVTGRSLMPVLLSEKSGQVDATRDHAVFGVERHFPGSRPEGAGYPMRGIRTAEYLYIENLAPDRNPVGDHPGPVWPEDDPVGGYGDTDGGPTKTYLWEHREQYGELFRLAFGKRPAEELYSVGDDPFNMNNLADDPAHADIKKQLSERLREHLMKTGDPRVTGRGELLDAIMKKYPVLGSNR